MLITNGNVTVQLQNIHNLHKYRNTFLKFLSPFFWKVREQHFDLSVSFLNYDHHSEHLEEDEFSKETCIRRSSAEPFNLYVSLHKDSEGTVWAHDRNNKVAYKIFKGSKRVEFYSAAEATERSFIHLIEFFRYIVLLIEEAKGTCVLHGSAVTDKRSEAVLLILGHKGSGKTSVLLDLVLNGEFNYFSGDKILVSLNSGRLTVRGWPDYPHIGLGTLLCHPAWCKKLNLDIDNEATKNFNKTLISPLLFRRTIPFTDQPVSGISYLLFPSYKNSPELSISTIASQNKKPDFLYHFFESPGKYECVRWYKPNLDLPPEANNNKLYEIMNQLMALSWIKLEGRLLNIKLNEFI